MQRIIYPGWSFPFIIFVRSNERVVTLCSVIAQRRTRFSRCRAFEATGASKSATFKKCWPHLPTSQYHRRCIGLFVLARPFHSYFLLNRMSAVDIVRPHARTRSCVRTSQPTSTTSDKPGKKRKKYSRARTGSQSEACLPSLAKRSICSRRETLGCLMQSHGAF